MELSLLNFRKCFIFSPSIFINPENIDVNVHPTKHEVHFLYEELIIESIQKTIEGSLLNCNSSRTYYMQSLLPSTSAQISNSTGTSAEEESKVYDYKLVRTDAKEKKLDAFTLPKSLTNEQAGFINNCARKPVHLTSVLSLLSEIKKNRHDGNISSVNFNVFTVVKLQAYITCFVTIRLLVA